MRENPQSFQAFLSDPDVVLMLEARAGNRAAFESLMRKYYKRIFNFIYRVVGIRVEAEDLTQDVFIKVYRAAGTYQPQAKFQTWLYTVAKNTALNALRNKRHAEYSLDQEIDRGENEISRQIEDPSAQNPRDVLSQKELARTVRAAIAELPESQRLAVLLRRYENLAYEDIAMTLDVSVAAVKSLLSRAKENLHTKLRGFLACGERNF